ncbi:MAG: Gfo/Idh/MocA family oxidoreductase [Bacteroidetes bacterium]|nr:Gfo/Idh/MocA family oxidoreductase [Bacteroidota bacterium]
MELSRRNFIRQNAVATAGIGMATVLPSGIWKSAVAPSDKVNVALIGCRNMGFGILTHHLSNTDVNCVALCDIDENILNEKAAEIRSKHNQNPKLYKDFRKLLEQKDIDAVIIGTPDHWHCLQYIYALQAEKDVYVEKPMANSIGEVNLMVKAASRYNKRVIQIGQQQRSGFIFGKAMELVKSGKIGNLRKINVWANFEYGVGPEIVPDEAVPAGVDYDMWLGPAPERPYNKNRFHGSWRHFWDYGGGLMSDWGVHLIDIALWSNNRLQGPEKVMVYGDNTFKEKRARETFDSMTVSFPGSKLVINWDMTAGVQRGPYDLPYGLAFVGDNATLVVNRSKLTVYPEWDNKEKKAKAEEYTFTDGKESHGEHVRNFIDCIKNRSKTACTPDMGRAAALHVHMANIAARVGEPVLLWDEAKGIFTNSSAANALITPAYRKPWTLPVI